MIGLRSTLRDEKGTALVLVALSMVALLSAIALAVDVGMLVTTRTEAQRVSDLSALAGAGILAIDPDAESAARTEAINFAALNAVRGDFAVVLPEDVDVNLDSSTVTVRMIRTEMRGTPVGTFFARIFGVNAVDISATATAIAEPAGPNWGVDCMLPIMLPDRWSEGGVSPNWPGASDSFDTETDPLSKDFDDDGNPDVYDSAVTGYNAAVAGDPIQIHKAGGGGGGINPSWYYPWTPHDNADQLVDGGAGASTYLNRFTTCLEGTYLVGDSILTEPGAMVGPTNSGFDALFNTDPEMIWNPDGIEAGKGCPWRPSKPGCDYNSPRIRPMPMFDPTEAPHNGRKIVHITNVGSVFVTTKSGNAFNARWLGLLATDIGDATSESTPGTAGLPKKLRLIK